MQAQDSKAHDRETVIVVCGDNAVSATMVQRLSEAGFGVIGPASSARMALALAAQSPISMALVTADLSDGRPGRDLAHDLMSNWGVRSMVLEAGAEVAEWTLASADAARLSRALVQADPTLA